MLDSFGHDPWAKNSMLQTAENVAREAGITREAQEEITLLRYRQYESAMADGSAFLKRYMLLPLEIKDARGKKVVATVTGDEGVHRDQRRRGSRAFGRCSRGARSRSGRRRIPPTATPAMLLVAGRDRARGLSPKGARGRAAALLRPGAREEGLHADGRGAGGRAGARPRGHQRRATSPASRRTIRSP